MDFSTIAEMRRSCRKYDPTRQVEQDKLDAILATARLAPSACNGQPYHITVCYGSVAKKIAASTQSAGNNLFTSDAPIMLVISEKPYNERAEKGAKAMNNDYRSMDIGILAAYITAEATAQGLGSCMIGWYEDVVLRNLCDVNEPIRLVIALGYPSPDDCLHMKKRKSLDELVSMKGDQ